MIASKAALFFLASTSSLLQAVQGQSCSFTRSFGSGGVLSSSGTESFEAAANAGTTCSLSCGGLLNAGIFLYLRYGGEANPVFNDASGSAATGCGVSVSLTSSNFQTTLGYQVLATAYDNLQLTCTCTNPGTTSGCFSKDATVDVQGQNEPVRMDALKVGDKVKTSTGYQKVYSFGHQEEAEEMEFIQLYTDPKEQPLELSKKHLVFLDETSYLFGFWPQTKAVRADTVKEGDVLLLESSQKAAVTKVGSVTKEGAYMPLTPEGTILVNGIQASSYVSISDEGASKTLATFDVYNFSEQNLAHWWMSPFRMLCMGVSSNFCSTNPKMMSQYHDETQGILKWLLMGREYARVADNLSFIVHHVLGVPTFFLFGFCLLIETLFGAAFAPTAVFAMASLGAWYASRRNAAQKA